MQQRKGKIWSCKKYELSREARHNKEKINGVQLPYAFGEMKVTKLVEYDTDFQVLNGKLTHTLKDLQLTHRNITDYCHFMVHPHILTLD